MDGKDLIARIKQDDEQAFAELFNHHYAALCGYANKYLKDLDLAEEIVQNLFCTFWEKRSDITISISISSYLYGAVRNRCLNEIRHQKTRVLHHDHIRHQEAVTTETDAVTEIELDQRIEDAIANLPEASRKAFVMSRVDGKKYADIASELGISVKAVEANISRALRKLRVDLKDYLAYLILIFLLG